MDLYENHIKSLIQNTPIKQADIFYFDGIPLEDEFKSAFKFYHETLQNSQLGGINSYIYFNNNFSSNAKAVRHNDYFMMSFSYQVIPQLVHKLKNNGNLLKDIKEFEYLSNFPLNELLFHFTLHYTFYHELGHLIQKSDLLEEGLHESYDRNSQYSEKRHVLELDADEYSAINLAAHISHFVRSEFGENIRTVDLENFLVLFSSTILFHLLSFKTFESSLYFKEHSHPHPIIRLTEIISVIISHTTSTLAQNGINRKLDENIVVRRTMQLSLILNKKMDETHDIAKFQTELEQNYLDVESYIHEFRDIRRGDKNLSVYKWNITVKAMHK